MPFKEIFWQDSAIALLKASYQNNRLAHAYLCVGPSGVGKKKVVTNFTKLLFCDKRNSDGACGVCPSCLKIESNSHADVYWIEPDGQNIRIDAVREVCRRLSLKGFESSRKVLVVDQAQCLSEESSSALLKTLEEPSLNTVIFLLADSIKSVLPTIVSRCQRVMFSSLPETVLAQVLTERFRVDSKDALYCARIAQGSMGEAVKFCENGLSSRKNEIIKNFLSKSCPLDKCLEVFSGKKADKPDNRQELLSVLLSWFRDILLAKAALPEDCFINADSKDEILRLSSSFSLDDIINRIASIAEASIEKKHNINMRVSLAKLRVDLWK
ncbi:MAG: DNA polymerase III subunit delta' [Candidatus Omnitrophota bacterium]